MAEPLLEHDGGLVPGTVVERPNRFVLRVRFGPDAASVTDQQSADGAADAVERVHLGDPGALSVLDAGRRVLCRPGDDPSRTTAWDAIAGRASAADCWVGHRPALATAASSRHSTGASSPGTRRTTRLNASRRSRTTDARTSGYRHQMVPSTSR